MIYCYCFFFNDTATTEIYTLSLHDALPICPARPQASQGLADASVDRVRGPRFRVPHGRDRLLGVPGRRRPLRVHGGGEDRKSTRLNSSHANISYAVFCLKKKNHMNITTPYA